MAVVQIIAFEEQANNDALVATGAVPYETIDNFVDPTNPIPALATNRFYQIGDDVAQSVSRELNNELVNGSLADLFFLGMSAHETNGRTRLSIAVSSAVVDSAKYPTCKQVRIRGWEQIMVPTNPAPTTANNFLAMEENPILDPRERTALTDHVALLTAVPLVIGVNVPGAGRALIQQVIVLRHGLSMILTAEFTFNGSTAGALLIDLP